MNTNIIRNKIEKDKIITNIIRNKIEKDEKLSNVHLNCKTDKIEIGDHVLRPYEYDLLLYKFRDEYPDIKFTKIAIRDVLTTFAIKNKYKSDNNEAENKHENYCTWYDKYEVDNKGKILKSLYNIFVLFENDPRFKGKFSFDEDTYSEIYDNKHIDDYYIAEFRSICERELKFWPNKCKLNRVIRILTEKDLYNIIYKNISLNK